MQIACVVPLYPPHSRVGAWLSTHECLKGLVAAGHEVTVVAHMANHDDDCVDGITVRSGAGPVPELVRGADVVITHAGDNGIAHTLAWDAGIPTVVMVHGALNPATETRFLLRPPTLTVANAQATAATVVWPGRLDVVHPPVWPAEHQTDPGDRITLVNLSRAKGGSVFWQLAHLMHHRRFLGVYGDYGHQVHGWWFNTKTSMSVDDMRQVWSQTRILLMPSEKETWGRVGVEAMCAGIPVIAHPTPGLCESLGDAGIFCDRDDLDAWVTAIETLSDPQVWQRASQRALWRAYAFDPAGDVRRYTRLVESVGR